MVAWTAGGGCRPAAEVAQRGKPPAGEEISSPKFAIRRWEAVPEFDQNLAVFESVFWEPDDSASLREMIRGTPLVEGKSVLEIGTGSGYISLCCLQAGAERVVATDINPAAVANADYNAQWLGLGLGLGLEERLDTRLVPLDNPAAFAVIDEGERFDVIISNPPWEDDAPKTIEEYALYDRNFALLESLLAGLRSHLRPGGKLLLAYGTRAAVLQVLERAEQNDLDVKVLDERQPDDLPPLFLPGMLLEVTAP